MIGHSICTIEANSARSVSKVKRRIIGYLYNIPVGHPCGRWVEERAAGRARRVSNQDGRA